MQTVNRLWKKIKLHALIFLTSQFSDDCSMTTSCMFCYVLKRRIHGDDRVGKSTYQSCTCTSIRTCICVHSDNKHIKERINALTGKQTDKQTEIKDRDPCDRYEPSKQEL